MDGATRNYEGWNLAEMTTDEILQELNGTRDAGWEDGYVSAFTQMKMNAVASGFAGDPPGWVFGLFRRVRAAWCVFIGRADHILWPAQVNSSPPVECFEKDF